MTQEKTISENEPSLDFDTDAVFEKKQTVLSDLNAQETYVIKSLQNDKILDAYDGIVDFSTEEGKTEFNFLQKLITKNNWLVIPSSLYKEYELGSVTAKDLEESINTTHEKLNIQKPNFNIIATEKIKNDFVSNPSEVEATSDVKNFTKDAQAPLSGINNGEAVKLKPSEILTSFDISVKHKINEINYHRSKAEKNKGKVSIKSLVMAGGVFAVGVLFTPLSAITVPAAMAIGGFAVLKGMFGKNTDIKNYDKQIEALQEATAKMVLKGTGEDSKQNVTNFVKNNKNLTGTLFDEKIEAEFARICKVRNIKIDTTIFKNAFNYENGHVVDYNRTVKTKKM